MHLDARRLLKDSPKLKVTQVLARYRWQARLAEQGYSDKQLAEISRVLNVITACRTGKLGSHLFTCRSCQRTMLGLDKCGNRHCTSCSEARRNQWRSDLTEWSLACDYWHCVFTLAHELNPLMRTNPRETYKLLLSCARETLTRRLGRQMDCKPGIVMTLHTWGQLMNAHIHVHVIVTAGGLSSDGQRWVPIPAGHPVMDEVSLAADFKQMYLRRLRFRLRRDALCWPDQVDTDQSDAQASPAAADWQDSDWLDSEVSSTDCLESQAEPPAVDAPTEELADEVVVVAKPNKLGRTRLRELTADEQQLIDVIEKKRWKVHCLPTPPEHQGAAAIVNYLAAYVSGTAIGNSRLISDDGVNVTFRYKDYRTNEKKTFTLPGPEFVQRFCEHILPPLMLRVRYCGLFATDGRAARLEHCRKLIDAAADDATSQELNDEPELLRSADEEGEDEDEGIVPSGCTCRYCHTELEVAGRLKGTETLELLALARSILALLPTMMQWVSAELMEQLRSVAIDLQRLPKPLRKLLANPWWQPLELSALAALLQHDPQPAVPPPEAQAASLSGLHTSGIPPPKRTEKARRA